MIIKGNKAATAFLSILFGMTSITSFAYDIKVMNEDGIIIYYSWNDNKTELAVSSGDYDFSGLESGRLVIPENVAYQRKVYQVTSIEKRAFYYCRGLKSVVISNSVITIGEDAFNHCENLKSVVISNSVTSIKRCAFYCCSSLNNLVIPNSVTSIETSAFLGCEALKSVVIPNSVTSIGNKVFQGCSDLLDVVIPNSVKSIGDQAFYGCNKMTSVTLPDSLISIGNQAFGFCSSLTSITIPESVISIGQAPFYDDIGLTSVKICCNTDIGGWFAYLPNIREVVIGDKVKSIGDEAFCYCSSLSSITISPSVTSIGESAFVYCDLTNVSIPNSVMAIGKEAFRYCEQLRKVTIEGNPVIDELAFQNCYLLDSIVLKSQTPPEMTRENNDIPGSDVYPFMEYTFANAVLCIPDSSYDAYAASDTWSRFDHICSSIDDESNSVSEKDPDNTDEEGYDPNFEVNSNTDDEVYEPDNENDSDNTEEYESDFECGSIYYTYQDDGVYAAARSVRGCNDYNGDGPLTTRDPNAGGLQPRAPQRSTPRETAAGSIDYAPYHGNIVIPESVSVNDTVYSVTGIKHHAFQGCDELESVVIPNSVKQIGYAGFAECTSLTGITIPAGVELIGKYAFAYCSGLKQIIIEGNPVIDETAFIGCGTDLEVIMAGNKNNETSDPDDDTFDPDPSADGTIHYGIDGHRIQPYTPGLHLIKRRDGTVVMVLVR